MTVPLPNRGVLRTWLNLDVNRRQQIVEGAEWQKTASNISTLEGVLFSFPEKNTDCHVI